MKKLIAGAFIAVSLAGTATVATADPGPHHGNNLFGLCTAWSANENGRDHGNAENAPPFAALQKAAEDAGYDTVEAYCAENASHPGGQE